jgi:hypothetical protein
MKLYLISLFFTNVTLFSTLGVGTGILTCKSESGRTVFKAEIEECNTLQNAELIIDSSKSSFNYKDNEHVVCDLDNHVLTIFVETKDQTRFLKFWAIPSSFKTILDKSGPGSQFHKIYEFKAIIFGRDPRQGKEYNTPEIEINCRLDYEL